jgi:hypothetical protein
MLTTSLLIGILSRMGFQSACTASGIALNEVSTTATPTGIASALDIRGANSYLWSDCSRDRQLIPKLEAPSGSTPWARALRLLSSL